MTSYKKIMNIALPAIAENFLQMFMNMIDSYLVSSLGVVAISGVSVAGNIITIYQAIFIALAAAVSSLISKNLERKNPASLSYQATEALKLTLFLSLVLGLLSIFAGQFFLSLLGTEEAVAQAGGHFLALVGGSIFLLGLMTSLGALVRVTNNPRLPMYASLISNILNVIFSSLAIFGLGLGITGVALGTILARLIGAWLLWRRLNIPLAPWSWSLDSKLLALSLPAAGERLMMRAGDVVIVAIVVKFGTDAVAGNAIGEVLSQFNYVPGFGVATATVILIAQAFGQEDWSAIQTIKNKAYYLTFFLLLAVALTVFILGQPLTLLFTSKASVIEASLSVILFSLLGVPMTAGTLVYTALWQGLGQAQLPFYATSLGMWLIRIVLGYVLGISLGLGLEGVWTATLLDNGFRWFFLSSHYRQKLKTLKTFS
ncbi:MATE family efflux transporter [Streptococcus oricebi]|uniref:Probable multidrug resistance protein NorM n=1 Tax=Streptococcus oricebi TaxID=1547447 RepID=A0ABS5B5W1_9STRE|nr:MATE family efflux transporter [Streptococcus oricebi]MBP2624226.1 MATE family efflux transporter [Streptococcus oricebi]